MAEGGANQIGDQMSFRVMHLTVFALRIVLLIVTALFALVLGILYAIQRRKPRARPPM